MLNYQTVIKNRNYIHNKCKVAKKKLKKIYNNNNKVTKNNLILMIVTVIKNKNLKIFHTLPQSNK